MSAVAVMPLPDTELNFLIRLKDRDILFVPITDLPKVQNFFLLETCEHYKYSEKDKKFVACSVCGVLSLQKEGNKRRLEGFKAPTLEQLMNKVAKRVATHYFRI